MNSHWHNAIQTVGVGSRLVHKEIRQNFIIYLSPILILLPTYLYYLISGKPILLGAKASVIGLVIAFVFAIIYGLQGFAGETDRKTIDFLLSRPVSPALLIGVKFFVNLCIYLLWLLLIAQAMVFNWSLLHLPKVVNGNGIVLVFPIILSMGFFSGLILRGSERLVVTVGLASLMGGGCYLLWNQAFQLMAASNYWFDIPPHIIAFVSQWLPGILLLLSLATPLVLAFWFIRGRYPFYRFKPIRRLIYLWVYLAFTIWIANLFLGPAIWPINGQLCRGGDWHPRSGVVIGGNYFKEKYSPSRSLYIAHIGGKAHLIYKGLKIHSARWSPDGQSIVFVDQPWIKVWQQTGVKRIAKGYFPYWSQNGQSIAFVKNPDKHQQFTGVYVYSLKDKSVKQLFASPKLRIVALAWDSVRSKLFLLHDSKRIGWLEIIDLHTKKEQTVKASTTEASFFLQSPTIELGQDGRLFLAVSNEREAHASVLFQGKKEFYPLSDNQGSGIDILSQTILTPTGEGYLVPRNDGAYDFRGFIPPDADHDEDKPHTHIHNNLDSTQLPLP